MHHSPIFLRNMNGSDTNSQIYKNMRIKEIMCVKRKDRKHLKLKWGYRIKVRCISILPPRIHLLCVIYLVVSGS